MEIYTKNLHGFLDKMGDEDIARKQSQYMRNRFPFFGLMKDDLEKYWKEYQEENGYIDAKNFIAFCSECALYSEREMWYIACKTIVKYKKKLGKEDLGLIHDLIIKSDWWDIVDTLSSHAIGALALQFPDLKPTIHSWIESENFWLRRTAILYQLSYKKSTDESALFTHILACCHESEFFIRKAIGWSLREYSKWNPESVKKFIEKNKGNLSALSIREGSKYI
jgi:3-methyladenine DNA glycosylase AlkD